jgi:hypothetical protein
MDKSGAERIDENLIPAERLKEETVAQSEKNAAAKLAIVHMMADCAKDSNDEVSIISCSENGHVRSEARMKELRDELDFENDVRCDIGGPYDKWKTVHAFICALPGCFLFDLAFGEVFVSENNNRIVCPLEDCWLH